MNDYKFKIGGDSVEAVEASRRAAEGLREFKEQGRETTHVLHGLHSTSGLVADLMAGNFEGAISRAAMSIRALWGVIAANPLLALITALAAVGMAIGMHISEASKKAREEFEKNLKEINDQIERAAKKAGNTSIMTPQERIEYYKSQKDDQGLAGEVGKLQHNEANQEKYLAQQKAGLARAKEEYARELQVSAGQEGPNTFGMARHIQQLERDVELREKQLELARLLREEAERATHEVFKGEVNKAYEDVEKEAKEDERAAKEKENKRESRIREAQSREDAKFEADEKLKSPEEQIERLTKMTAGAESSQKNYTAEDPEFHELAAEIAENKTEIDRLKKELKTRADQERTRQEGRDKKNFESDRDEAESSDKALALDMTMARIEELQAKLNAGPLPSAEYDRLTDEINAEKKKQREIEKKITAEQNKKLKHHEVHQRQAAEWEIWQMLGLKQHHDVRRMDGSLKSGFGNIGASFHAALQKSSFAKSRAEIDARAAQQAAGVTESDEDEQPVDVGNEVKTYLREIRDKLQPITRR